VPFLWDGATVSVGKRLQPYEFVMPAQAGIHAAEVAVASSVDARQRCAGMTIELGLFPKCHAR
jgi:hypothetical protein